VNQPSTASRVRQAILLAGVAAFAVYAFSPAIQNRFGSVKPRDQRLPVSSDVAVKTLDGHDWSLAANRGKVILVNFWATWCPPCRMETPALVQLHNEFASQGFTVAGINTDDPGTSVPEFVRKYSISYPVLIAAASFPMLDSVESLNKCSDRPIRPRRPCFPWNGY
jgi:thiol-disulfide isomerase/thioredoxin